VGSGSRSPHIDLTFPIHMVIKYFRMLATVSDPGSFLEAAMPWFPSHTRMILRVPGTIGLLGA